MKTKKKAIVIIAICLAAVMIAGVICFVAHSNSKAVNDTNSTTNTAVSTSADSKAPAEDKEAKDKATKTDKPAQTEKDKTADTAQKSSDANNDNASQKTSSNSKPSASPKKSDSVTPKPAAHVHTKATRSHTETETKYKETEVWHSADVCGCGYRTESQSAWSAHCDAHAKNHEGYRSWVDEWCTTTKTPYTVTHTITETYCTSCGKVLSTSRS